MLTEIDDVVEYILHKNGEGLNFFEEFNNAVDNGTISNLYCKYKFHGFFSKSNIDFWELVHMDLPRSKSPKIRNSNIIITNCFCINY